MEESLSQENCSPSDKMDRKRKRKHKASHKGEGDNNDFHGTQLVVDSGGVLVSASRSEMHEDAPLLSESKKKKKKKRKEKQDVEETDPDSNVMPVGGPSSVSRDSEKKRKKKKKKNGKEKQDEQEIDPGGNIIPVGGPSSVSRDSNESSEPVDESNISLEKKKKKEKKKEKKEKRETEVGVPNNIIMPAERRDFTLQESIENTELVLKSNKKSKKRKHEDKALEQLNGNNSAEGADSAAQESNEKIEDDGILVKSEKKKKKRKKKQKSSGLDSSDNCASAEGPVPLLPEVNVETEQIDKSDTFVGKKKRKRQKTGDIGPGDISAPETRPGYISEIAEMDVKNTGKCSLTSDHQNGAVNGATACSVKKPDHSSLVENAGLTDCSEHLRLHDQKVGLIKVVSMGNTSIQETQEHKNGEVLQLAEERTSQFVVECVDASTCNKGADYVEYKASVEDADIKSISSPTSEAVVSEDTVMQTVEGVKPQPILNSLSGAANDRIFKKKLLVLDLNGLLVDVIQPVKGIRPDMLLARKHVFRRPFVDDFIRFCLDRFVVAIWSSRTWKNINPLVNFLFGNSRRRLLFCWDRTHCTLTNFTTLENEDKPLVLKELRRVWDEWGYCESNTLLLDDSPYKALCNPENTAIFPHTYRYTMREDNSLGPGGDLRVYLENLASSAENIPKYVRQNPFGQSAITRSDPSWDFYERVLSEVQPRKKKRVRQSRWDR